MSTTGQVSSYSTVTYTMNSYQVVTTSAPVATMSTQNTQSSNAVTYNNVNVSTVSSTYGAQGTTQPPTASVVYSSSADDGIVIVKGAVESTALDVPVAYAMGSSTTPPIAMPDTFMDNGGAASVIYYGVTTPSVIIPEQNIVISENNYFKPITTPSVASPEVPVLDGIKTPLPTSANSALTGEATGVTTIPLSNIQENNDSNSNVFIGDYLDFKDAVGFAESSDNYNAVNQYGYMGRYQFGTLALTDIGFLDSEGNWTELAKSYGVESSQDYLNNHSAQDVAFDLLVKKQLSYISYYGLNQYIGEEMNGIMITESGMVAAGHLIGIGGLIEALRSGELGSVKDGNGVSAKDYLERFGGYDITQIKG